MFKIKDKIYHPKHGLCEVKAILMREEKPTYILKPAVAAKKLQRIELKQEKIMETGVYQPVGRDGAEKINDILNNKPGNISEDRSEGYRNTKEKIYSGDLFKIAEAVRDLEALKDLLFLGEKRRLLKLAKNILINGLSHASGQDSKETEKFLEKQLCVFRNTISDDS